MHPSDLNFNELLKFFVKHGEIYPLRCCLVGYRNFIFWTAGTIHKLKVAMETPRPRPDVVSRQRLEDVEEDLAKATEVKNCVKPGMAVFI